MTSDLSEPGPARQRRRVVIVVAGVVLLVAVVSAIALARSSADEPAAGVTVVWAGSEGHPPCVYDPTNQTVEAHVTIEGTALPQQDTVTVTVTAYADENTSKAVGSSSRRVEVEGSVNMLVDLTIAVEKAPHVDEDGVAACRLSVEE
jgi:hypothetical protein